MVQDGPNGQFGQNPLIPNWILHSRDQNGPKWSILVHLGPPTVLWSFLIVGNSEAKLKFSSEIEVFKRD